MLQQFNLTISHHLLGIITSTNTKKNVFINNRFYWNCRIFWSAIIFSLTVLALTCFTHQPTCFMSTLSPVLIRSSLVECNLLSLQQSRRGCYITHSKCLINSWWMCDRHSEMSGGKLRNGEKMSSNEYYHCTSHPCEGICLYLCTN